MYKRIFRNSLVFLLLITMLIPITANAAVTPTKQFISHRGDNYYAPENTMAAFKLAKSKGYSAIECDVQCTNSGDLIVIHDTNLKKYLNDDRIVATLCDVDAKETVIKGNHWEEYPINDVTIPSFNKVVKWASNNNMTVYFHLKGENGKFNKTAMKKMIKSINKYNMKKKAILYMHNNKFLELLKPYAEDGYRIGMCRSGKKISTLKKDAKKARKTYKCKYITFRYFEGITDKASLVDYCHDLGLKVSYYDVVTTEHIKKLKKIGADAWMMNKLPD